MIRLSAETRSGGWGRSKLFAVMLASFSLCAGIAAACEAPKTPAIGVESLRPTGEIILKDGRSLRLVGLLWPASSDKAGRKRLVEALTPWLIGGRLIVLPLGKPDRWGRILAQAFSEDPGHAPVWLQGMLAENGYVMIWPEPEARGCWDGLRLVEKAAARQGLGLWSPLMRRARRLRIMQDGAVPLNPRVIFEAKVRSVREGRTIFFVNFAGNRAKTPYLSISKRSVDEFKRQGLDLATFSGKSLRVRGILGGVFARSSAPRLEIAGPQAIEVLE